MKEFKYLESNILVHCRLNGKDNMRIELPVEKHKFVHCYQIQDAEGHCNLLLLSDSETVLNAMESRLGGF